MDDENACRHLEATAGHVIAFADMLTTRTGDHEHLSIWMSSIEADASRRS